MKDHGIKYNKNAAAVLLLASTLVQILVISYNHLTNYYTIETFFEAMARLSFGTTLVFIVSSALLIINRQIFIMFDYKLEWENNFIKRLFLEMGTAALASAVLLAFITFTLSLFNVYEGENLNSVIVTNMLIAAVVNIIYMSILEAIIFYKTWREEKVKTERLKSENAITRYEALKNQVNPHFLFNNLNILASLISIDQTAAEKYVQDFSSIYRYILDNSDKIVVTVKSEIEFVKSYLKLLKIRHNEGINYEIKIDSFSEEKYIVPLGMQIVIENCAKHNQIATKNPLNISIYNNNMGIYIENNLIKKEESNSRSGIGLKNITERYSYLTDTKPEFFVNNNNYISFLPFIPIEE